MPIGTVFTTNITPDRTHGIGSYSYGQFERAVRRGIAPRGYALYPAMPYPSYARLSDADTRALYAYFMHGVQPVAGPDRQPDIVWPFSWRWPLTYWRWVFAPSVQPATDAASADPELARGAYLVEGPGHCGACHTPRGVGLEEEALTDKDGSKYLAGAVVGGFFASDLRGDPITGLGSWSEQEILEFLKSGHNAHSAVFGGMSDVVRHSAQFISDTDLGAIAHYLKSLPPAKEQAAFLYKGLEAKKLAALDVSTPGALDYMNNCSACHLSSGKGYDETFPALAGNPVVVARDPVSVINLILVGSTRPATADAPTDFAMPGFADRLTDREVANLATFVRSSWGNRAGKVSPAEVAAVRKNIGAAAPILEGTNRR
jgi:alcohol dehydrogenase (quinone), cytochrome c subunit